MILVTHPRMVLFDLNIALKKQMDSGLAWSVLL